MKILIQNGGYFDRKLQKKLDILIQNGEIIENFDSKWRKNDILEKSLKVPTIPNYFPLFHLQPFVLNPSTPISH